MEQEGMVQEKVNLLCAGFERCASNGTVIRVTHAFAAYGADVITQYAFGFTHGQLEKDGWPENYHDAYIALNEFGHVVAQHPWLGMVSGSNTGSLRQRLTCVRL